MTHPAATDALVREIFGEVHMLSHLIGSANRADIRRLKELETENALLRDKLARQQERLHEAVATRDTRIRDLGALLAGRIADRASNEADGANDREAALGDLVGRLERRLRSETHRRAALEDRLATAQEELGRERARRAAVERRERALRGELDAIEADLGSPPASEGNAVPSGLAGLSVLYVGGRPDKLGHLRAAAEQSGARFLHHDGGIEDRGGLLAGSVGRADIVMFPVDCVSHDAVATVKRLCRQTAKPYVPLRSTGMSSFIAALLNCKENNHDGH